MDRLSEENVTKKIMNFLLDHDWNIIDYDFPGSGTGRPIKTSETSDKNKKTIIPDIVAIKCNHIVILESKSKDTISDYDKIDFIAKDQVFLNNIKNTYKTNNAKIFFGICFSGKPINLHKIHKYKAISLILLANNSVDILYNTLEINI